MALWYVRGDATQPIKRPAIIAHICNNAGQWGAGFTMAISARWPAPEKAYRAWSKERDFRLGDLLLVDVEKDVWVANMVAQDNIRGVYPPVRYDALERCLDRLAHYAKALNASVHMPRIGCGIGGGKWEEVENLILETLPVAPNVCVYDLP
jgi:O-acetyl-ADP-ribose deacetylase (regulator of RNase III)